MLQTLEIKTLGKYVTLQNLSIYCTWKNIRQQYKNNKLKIVAPTWNDEFELTNGSHETFADNLPIHIYINRSNNRSVLKIKDGCKLALQRNKTIKLFRSTKKLKDKKKNGENMASPDIDEVASAQGNLVDDQYQQKPKMLHTFTSNKYYGDLLNVQPSKLVFLKTYNTELDDITITSTN